MAGVAVDITTAGIVSLDLPTNPDDAASKAYVDGMAKGLSIHAPARAISVTNISLSSPPSLLDGVLLKNLDRILVAGQTDSTQNGIYIFHGAGVAMTRSDDGIDPYIKGGDYVFINEGVLYPHTAWVLFTDPPISVGTTPLDWQQFAGLGQVVVGGGLTQMGTQIDVGKGDGISVLSNNILLDLDVHPGLELVGTSPNGKLRFAPDGSRGLARSSVGAFVKLPATDPGIRFTLDGELNLKLDSDGALTLGDGGLAVVLANPDELYFDLGYLRISGLPKNFRVGGDNPVGDFVTAAALTQLTDGSSGDNLHSHSPPPELSGTVEYWTASGPIYKGQGVFISAPGVVSMCSCLDPVPSRCIGVASTTVIDGETVKVVPVGIVAGVLDNASIGTRFFVNHLGYPVNIPLVPKGSRLIQMGIAISSTDLMVYLHDYGTQSNNYASNVTTTMGELVTDSTGEDVTT